ncbi:MAG: histidine phosphatase family protein [bacterium]
MKVQAQAKLILIRHGETKHNAAGKFQGHFDSELSKKGFQQAEAVAKRVASTAFAALYSSDLKRTMQTAQPIFQETRHAIIADARLRERDFGIFQNHSLREIQEKFPEAHAKFSLQDPDYVIPQGESSNQLTKRVMAVFEEIANRHAGETVVIITHGGPIGALLRYTLGLPYKALRRYSNYNTAFNIFFHKNGEWRLGTWGDISHLES